jgi:hypothetical protein
MRIQKLRLVGRLLIVSALASMCGFAENVTYSSALNFGGGKSTLLAVNNLTVAYTGVSVETVSPPFPTNAQFGEFAVTGPMTGTDTFNSTFSLTVTQTAPGPQSETLSDTLTGSISKESSNLELTFTGVGSGGRGPLIPIANPLTGAPSFAFTLANVTYWIDKVTPINPSTTGGGISTIEGAIYAAPLATPEPQFLVLTGLGFAALALMAIRRKSRAA